MANCCTIYKILPLLVLIISIWLVTFFRPKCHIFEPEICLHLGTKTPYRNVANLNTDSLNYSGCVPKKIWAIIRHGTREPTTEVAHVMNERLHFLKQVIVSKIDSGEATLCPEVKESFEKWVLNVHGPQYLTTEGANEMLLLGKRTRLRFPDLLSDKYSNTTYKFYKLCNKWRKTVSKNPLSVVEQKQFMKSDEMQVIVEKVSKRIGVQRPLLFDDIYLMYQMCSYETAWNSTIVSPWCVMFSVEDVKVLEYFNDLRYYWRDGYGFPLTYKQACAAFNDMIKLFTSESSEPKAVFYFTHSGTLLKLLSFLGLYKDNDRLLSSNYAKLHDRKWKVSQIDSFGTNLAFVLYKCGKTYKVLILHQERPVRIPGCPDGYDLCPLNRILDIFDNSIKNCNFNEMCSSDEL
ncbi:multiple inositol polyphosphate phosphatase 1-like isoform X2 [Lycorma delicatula]|uniref:multiple inositol polyphosphate phosphatase 1-like isoform X2 n=1 Tax=Lycorma delicatula TaxID=130591 RepID=UPI003F50F93F